MLVYSDSGKPPGRLFYRCPSYFQHWLKEKNQEVLPGINIGYYTGGLARWTKKAFFDYYKLNKDDYDFIPMIQASFLVFIKGKQSEAFIKDWLNACLQFILVSDATEQEQKESLPYFASYLNDQCPLSLLTYKYQLDFLDSDKGVCDMRSTTSQLNERTRPLHCDKTSDLWLERLGCPIEKHKIVLFLKALSYLFYFYERIERKICKILFKKAPKGWYS